MFDGLVEKVMEMLQLVTFQADTRARYQVAAQIFAIHYDKVGGYTFENALAEARKLEEIVDKDAEN